MVTIRDQAPASTTVLRVHDLALSFPRPRSLADLLLGRPQREIRALAGVSLELGEGETLGIVGESGCGKSTLARCIVGLHRPDRGRIEFEGRDVTQLAGARRRAFNRKVQMIFQDPYRSLNPRMTVCEMLDEALRVHRMRSPAEIPARISELLDLVRLPEDAGGKYPHQFSGGQRQRIAIARALALEPRCLVADEVVSALDVSVQAQVVNLILELQSRLRLSVLFVAHDLRLVRHVSHRVAVIYLGSVVELASAEALFTAPAHPYTAALLAAAPRIESGRRRREAALEGELPSPLAVPSGCPFHVRCPRATPRCAVEAPHLQPSGRGSVACHHPVEAA